MEQFIKINPVIERKLGLAMKKTFRRVIPVILFLGFLIPYFFCFINCASLGTKNNETQLNSSSYSTSKSGTIQLGYNEYFGVGGAVNMDLKFNFKSHDSNNDSKYVDVLYRVLSDSTYDLLKDYYNRTGNLKHILTLYPFKNEEYFDTAHACWGFYFKTGSPMYLVFINLAANETTIKLSYQIEFSPPSDSTTSEPPVDKPIPGDETQQILFNPIVLMFIVISAFIGIVIIILSVSKSHLKNYAEETPKVQYRTESLRTISVVSYCSWCGYKIKHVEKYCPHCGKEIEY